MRSRFASLAIPLLLACSAPDIRAADTLYELQVGARPLPRPLSYEEHETYVRLRNFGVVKQLPENVQDPARVELIELPAATVAEVIQLFGGPLEKLPSPAGMLSTSSPGYPPNLKARRETASARCQFEVSPDGSVGRIFTTNFSHREFALECGRALKLWRFSPAPAPRRFQILFEARP